LCAFCCNSLTPPQGPLSENMMPSTKPEIYSVFSCLLPLMGAMVQRCGSIESMHSWFNPHLQWSYSAGKVRWFFLPSDSATSGFSGRTLRASTLSNSQVPLNFVDLHQIVTTGISVSADKRFGICFLITQGMLPWLPILGWSGNNVHIPRARQNGLEDRNVNRCINSSDDCSTSGRNVVNFSPVIMDITMLDKCNFCYEWAKCLQSL